MIGFIVQTTILFAILYYFPLFGPIVDEAGIVGATVMSILASSGLLFLYDIWRAPVLIDAFQREDLASAISVARELLDSESKLKAVGDLHAEGMSILRQPLSHQKMTQAFDEWNKKCETFIGENFEFARLHAYKITGGLTSYVPERRSAFELLVDLFEGKLRALDNLISTGSFATMPHLQMKRIVDLTENPIYRFLLPRHEQ